MMAVMVLAKAVPYTPYIHGEHPMRTTANLSSSGANFDLPQSNPPRAHITASKGSMELSEAWIVGRAQHASQMHPEKSQLSFSRS